VRILAAIALASLLAAGQGSAETDAAAAAIDAAELLQIAAASLAEAEGARDRVEALTETVRAYEQGLRPCAKACVRPR
jgi:3-methyladenine DNA glycosylase/8-oxoguanine DNA glycosylase